MLFCNNNARYFAPVEPLSAALTESQADAICQFDGSNSPVECLLDADQNPIDYTDARTPDWTIARDTTCLGEVGTRSYGSTVRHMESDCRRWRPPLLRLCRRKCWPYSCMHLMNDIMCFEQGNPRYDCNGAGTKRMRFRVEDQHGFSTLYPQCIDNNDTINVLDMRCGG
jgi:hypothetical protein